MTEKKSLEKAEENYLVERKKLLTDWLRFFQNDELQTMLVVIVILTLLHWGEVITTGGLEKALMTAIAFGFSADGLNKLTTKR